MIIEKVLNNNVVVINENNIEQIVMGRGIAFQKKVGDNLDESKIDKVFTLTDKEVAGKFQELLVSIPMEHIELGEEIVTYARTKLGKKLNDTIYISLVDHIDTAITRAKEGINIKNFLLWDIKRFYKTEFEIGLNSLAIIKEKTGISLEDDEAGFIALHIVNAEMEEDKMHDVYQITKVMQEITNIVKYEFKIEFDEDSVYFYRFITHLKFFAQRLIEGRTYGDGKDDELLEIVMMKYHNAYNCVMKISEFIQKKYFYSISDEEKVYLTIHIERIVYKSN